MSIDRMTTLSAMKKFIRGHGEHTGQLNLYAQDLDCSPLWSDMRGTFQGIEGNLTYDDNVYN
jgi:hypothetical protein